MESFKEGKPMQLRWLTCCCLVLCPTLGMAEEPSNMLERVLPAVVTVSVYKTDEAKTPFGFGTAKTDVAYRSPLDLAGVESTGSGFVISHKEKKYIVTNAHVIEHASE